MRAAFGRAEEAELVHRPRQGGEVIAEAVAAEPGRILFSALPILRQGAVLQLGGPANHARFGFDAPLAARLQAPFKEGGEVRYAAAFGLGAW